MKKMLLVTIAALALGPLAGCARQAAAQVNGEDAKPADPAEEKRKAKVVARVDGKEITVGDMEEKIAASFQPSQYKDPAKRKELLNALVEERLMENEGMRRGYDKLPRVVDGVKRVLFNLIQTKYIEKTLSAEAVSKEEIAKYYEEHAADYHQPSLVRASHILVPDEAKAQALLQKAREKDFDLRKFRELAIESSMDELTKKRGGDLRYFSTEGKVWFSTETVPVEVAQAAFSQQVKLKGLEMVFADKDAAEKALKEAMEKKVDAAGWKKMAAKLSTDEASRKKGGDIGWFTVEGDVDGGGEKVAQEIAMNAFNFQTAGTIVPRVMKIGETYRIAMIAEKSDPGSLYPKAVKSPAGFHVVWIVGRRPSLHKTLEEVEYSIRTRLWQDKKKKYVDDFVDGLFAKYDVKVSEENLAKVVVDMSGVPPTAAAPGAGTPPPPPAPPVPAKQK